MNIIIKIVIVLTFGVPLFILFSITSELFIKPNKKTPEWVIEGDKFFNWLFS